MIFFIFFLSLIVIVVNIFFAAWCCDEYVYDDVYNSYLNDGLTLYQIMWMVIFPLATLYLYIRVRYEREPKFRVRMISETIFNFLHKPRFKKKEK